MYISLRIWITTWMVLSIGFLITALYFSHEIPEALVIGVVACGVAFVGSLPSLILLSICNYFVQRMSLPLAQGVQSLCISTLLVCLVYGFVGGAISFFINSNDEAFYVTLICAAVLYACSLIAITIHYKYIHNFYTDADAGTEQISEPQLTPFELSSSSNITIKATNMESDQTVTESTSGNKVLIKAAITGGLILVMLVPTLFIINLVKEREQRQKEVVAEVSNKWAKPQTLTGPYILLPYNQTTTGSDNKLYTTKKSIILLPEDLQVSGSLTPEERKRSIYTVLLYKTNLNARGNFAVNLPQEIDSLKLLFNEAKLCIGVNDFKGIEEKVSVNFNGIVYDLTPGLPTNEIDETGLSCSVPLSRETLAKPLPFSLNLKIKGSQQLGFVPLSGNSTFALTSPWPNPSFDGTSLPSERKVSETGFTAKWSFNKANLPFNTILRDFKMDKEAYQFGVSMVQPADQYAKTMRSVKYAILFIGLTFSLFFIVELIQKRPVHPVQYILVGLALVIFYTLLLSISEFLLFDNAYLIAAFTTVSLITLYAKGHFASWKVAGVFASVLGMLYGFIFVLIRLEDTALLVGSIGLFAVLALVMYASRRINWYNPTFNKKAIKTA